MGDTEEALEMDDNIEPCQPVPVRTCDLRLERSYSLAPSSDSGDDASVAKPTTADTTQSQHAKYFKKSVFSLSSSSNEICSSSDISQDLSKCRLHDQGSTFTEMGKSNSPIAKSLAFGSFESVMPTSLHNSMPDTDYVAMRCSVSCPTLHQLSQDANVTQTKSSATTSPSTPKKRELCVSNLTTLEEAEVESYEQVFFAGRATRERKVARLSHETADNNHGYDTDDERYILYAGDHVAYRYELLDGLGQGMYGDVVKAHDHASTATVAIKIIKNDPLYKKASYRECTFLHELRDLVPSGQSTSIAPRLLDTFEFRHHLCIVMEFIDGKDLYSGVLSQGKPLPTKDVKVFARQLVCAVAALHARQIIHCDLKPENIMVTSRGCLKIVDFGLSQYADEGVPGDHVQSILYRAPEIVLGAPFNTAIDIWSVGCIVAELFIFAPLFPCKSESELIHTIVEYLGMPPEYIISAGVFSSRYFSPSALRSAPFKHNCKHISDLFPPAEGEMLSFVIKCLQMDALARPTAKEALDQLQFSDSAYASRVTSEYLASPRTPALQKTPQVSSRWDLHKQTEL